MKLYCVRRNQIPKLEMRLVNSVFTVGLYDLLIVFDTDLIILGIPPTYMGFGPPIGIVTAGGSVRVEIQLLNFQSEPIPGWTFEEAVVVLSSEGAVRLSGNGMRQCLYFATAPGNTQLKLYRPSAQVLRDEGILHLLSRIWDAFPSDNGRMGVYSKLH
ncbi:hypothetical protein TESG_00849 [Trichophyton tonsurans CBS 112818]|uniref:Uncharacterized protein n=1 Tax=Trichophyton tonsurans (strain CBS 112818) TaxID=647933 RepID=F2RPR7_TRIT1|nr:hypothetical protein TESG_00849 [Trichophyton tonsurans CBS 112818]